MRVLITKFRHIGDVILTTPLFRNLKLNFPEWELDFGINRGCEELLLYNRDISNLILYDRPTVKALPFPARLKREWNFFRQFYHRYDIVINLTEGERGAIIAYLSGAKIKIGYPPKKGIFKSVYTHPLPPQGIRHTIDANLDPIKLLGGKIFEKRVYLHPDPIAIKKIARLSLPEKFVHCHPVSRWLFKTPPPDRTAKIIDFIQQKLGLPVVITAGPAPKELEMVHQILTRCTIPPISFAGQLTLSEVTFLNRQATLFIGVDTAIMHLSAANNTPVFALFGPSGAFHWGPWDNRLMESGYISRRGEQRMGIHSVYQRDWECIPCGKDGCNGSKISRCLVELELDKIFRRLEEMVSNQSEEGFQSIGKK